MAASGMPLVLAASIGAGAIAAGAESITPDTATGRALAVLLALLGAFTVWRAGTVRAWKETAEARAERLEDLERELGALRAELAIPERIEGLVRLMAQTAERQDEAATRRLELAFERLDRRWEEFNRLAQARSDRIVALLVAERSHRTT